MNYESKTNRELTEIIAGLRGLKVAPVTPSDSDGLIVYPYDNKVNFDPFNNPSDAWPIIVENEISLTKCLSSGNENWHADFIESIEEIGSNDDLFTCETSCNYYHKNPLRAAMICFLKMKESENEV